MHYSDQLHTHTHTHTHRYRVSGSHANPLAVKTDAPPGVVWDVVRCWVKQHPVRDPDPKSYAARLLAKEPKLEANFSRAQGAVSKSQAAGVARFVQNPAYWGPKSRHGTRLSEQQQTQQKAHDAGVHQLGSAAASAGTPSGASNGSGGGNNGARRRAQGQAHEIADAGELDALYGGLGGGSGGGGAASGGAGSVGGEAAEEGAGDADMAEGGRQQQQEEVREEEEELVHAAKRPRRGGGA